MLYIYCAGSYSAEIHDLVTRLGFINKEIAYVDDYKTELDKYSYEGEIFSFKKLLSIWDEKDKIIIGNGNPKIKSEIYNRLKENNINPSIFIDKTSIVSSSAKYKEGLIVMPFCSISSFADISNNVTISYNSNVGHHTKIGSNTFISSMVNIGGGAKIGSQVFIGMGAQIKEGISIGDNSIISMGSVVHKDIPPGLIAMGYPARPFLKNDKNIVFKS